MLYRQSARITTNRPPLFFNKYDPITVSTEVSVEVIAPDVRLSRPSVGLTLDFLGRSPMRVSADVDALLSSARRTKGLAPGDRLIFFYVSCASS